MLTLSKNVAAGLLLAAIRHLDRLGLPHPTATEAIAAASASRTTAYRLSGA